MINCSIPLILIGHHANDGGIMDGDTYLPQLHWEIFWGYLSKQWNESKQESKNSKQTHFKVHCQSYLESLLDS